MHIFNDVWYPHLIPSQSDEKNLSYHPDTEGGRMDGQMNLINAKQAL